MKQIRKLALEKGCKIALRIRRERDLMGVRLWMINTSNPQKLYYH